MIVEVIRDIAPPIGRALWTGTKASVKGTITAVAYVVDLFENNEAWNPDAKKRKVQKKRREAAKVGKAEAVAIETPLIVGAVLDLYDHG